jgi:hypothetical protein
MVPMPALRRKQADLNLFHFSERIKIKIRIKNGASRKDGKRTPHLTLTLSPPIGWERRGNSRRTRIVPRRTVEQRQVHGPDACFKEKAG